jgi:hypothetical protein
VGFWFERRLKYNIADYVITLRNIAHIWVPFFVTLESDLIFLLVDVFQSADGAASIGVEIA